MKSGSADFAAARFLYCLSTIPNVYQDYTEEYRGFRPLFSAKLRPLGLPIGCGILLTNHISTEKRL